MKEKYYYEEKNIKIILGDTFEYLKKIKSKSIDMIFADPPYFLSNGGVSNKGGKFVSVDKGEWDKISGFKDKYIFNRAWIKECKRILKNNGTIWITGTMHNIYSVGMALEQEEFKILNNITWEKTNPAPNLSCRYFTHSTETILWARKNNKDSRHYYNYELMKKINNGKQMKDVWRGSLTKASEKLMGKHPTQKPIYLLERILLASTKENDIILDPFLGSGTTGVVSKKLNRKFIGIDNNREYLDIAIKRIKNI